jgi:YHS domain-containing protein
LKKAVPGVMVNRGEELAIVVKVPDPAPAAAPASASASGSASKALNSKCPVSGKDVVLPNTLTHEGKLVAFCCDKCPKAFAAEPAKYAANIKFDIAATPEKKPEAKPADKKSDAKPADVKPADVKPVEKKVEEKKPEAKPAEAKPAEVKPVEKKPEEKKPAAAADPVPAAPAAVVVSTVNTKCPVSEHAIETGFTAVVDGRTVGFCCDKCLAKFNKDPKKFADKIVADAKK